MGRVKGSGADCLTLLAEVYEAAGIIPHVELEFYPPDWNLHRDAERYLAGVMQHAREFTLEPAMLVEFDEGTNLPLIRGDSMGFREVLSKPTPEPGDVAVFKFGRCYAHGAIVTEWPMLIHSWVNGGVLRGDATQPMLANRPVRFFDPFFESRVIPLVYGACRVAPNMTDYNDFKSKVD